MTMFRQIKTIRKIVILNHRGFGIVPCFAMIMKNCLEKRDFPHWIFWATRNSIHMIKIQVVS